MGELRPGIILFYQLVQTRYPQCAINKHWQHYTQNAILRALKALLCGTINIAPTKI